VAAAESVVPAITINPEKYFDRQSNVPLSIFNFQRTKPAFSDRCLMLPLSTIIGNMGGQDGYFLRKGAGRIPLKSFPNYIGVEGDRTMFTWVSASEGDRFAQVIKGVTARVRALGLQASW